MPKRVTLAAVVFAACVSGCLSPEEIAAHDAANCTGYGFRQGTPEFAQCMRRERLARRAPGFESLDASGPFGGR
jgi:hypothetical protein